MKVDALRLLDGARALITTIIGGGLHTPVSRQVPNLDFELGVLHYKEGSAADLLA